ncbi:hypothetical protein VNI00_018712 [Paramarasmius palmivorus]|uniref:Uncharacterized protein n=1 Tax=Paramarasmius palmivorus TaxID=297713 RepID=A0AAW0AU73_9AGAR
MSELEKIRQEREVRIRQRKTLDRDKHEMPLLPLENSQEHEVETNAAVPDNEKLARKRHQQATNSRRYYHKHRAEIRMRVKERRDRQVIRQAQQLQNTPEEERDSVLEAKRRKQREYSRKHREANRSAINERERERRRRAKESKREA